ncbi:helix-turn-helix transcriptional regulator [Corynebacterium halotolerans]|uniref:helix-turn-helix transcriptional regulator n=1 Tax=Corynebacterium halotolerans TaxID=225326 RepID=UPI003CEBB562
MSETGHRTATETRSTDGDTRREIMLTLLKHGPVTASKIGDHLGISAAGVRRHLDILVDEGLAEAKAHRRRPSSGAAPSRGRPAKEFRLTDSGRGQFGHGYDNLANLALAALRDTGGDEAVREFAKRRIADIVRGISPADVSDKSVEATARALAEAFGDHGYAATVTHAAGGVQICQHHCPISNVASEFPEICEAEHEAISDLVGVHVQQLASIAEGHGICTTNIPLTPINHSPDERSGS